VLFSEIFSSIKVVTKWRLFGLPREVISRKSCDWKRKLFQVVVVHWS